MARTAAEIRAEEEKILVERFELLYRKVWKSFLGFNEDELKADLRWRIHPEMYANIMTSEYLNRALMGYWDRYQAGISIMGIQIERDRTMPESEIVLRWEVKSDA